ncbi:hypothetical protein D3C76_343170 [compost metagenome]
MEFHSTKLATLFYSELWWLANSIVKKCDSIFSKTLVPERGYIIQVDPEIHALISSVLSDAANVKKLMTAGDKKKSGESGELFRLRRDRVRELREYLSGIELKELLNPKVRNTLEHFDEYLDSANYEVSRRDTPLGTMAAYNMVISHWDVARPRFYPVKLYISAERKFYNMKWSVDLGAIQNEAQAIVSKMKALPAFATDEVVGVLIRV